MTRINANIDPIDLCDQHLLAEYREMVRIPNFVLGGVIQLNDKLIYGIKKQPKINFETIPDKFKLGPGHVKFFYTKIRFLHYRFLKIKLELNRRKIKNNITDSSFNEVYKRHPHLYQDVNLDYANKIVMERILERIKTMKKFTFHGNPVDKTVYETVMKNKYANS